MTAPHMAHDPRVTDRRAFIRARAWVYGLLLAWCIHWAVQLFGG